MLFIVAALLELCSVSDFRLASPGGGLVSLIMLSTLVNFWFRAIFSDKT